MVRFCLFFLMLSFTLSLVGQGNCDTVPFRHWVEFPIFDKSAKNDIESLFYFFAENLKYPETAKADKIDGKVIVEFWIDTDGYTSEHRIIQGIRQDLDDEVLRVAKLLKFDIPAKSDGDCKPIGLCYRIPFTYTLDAEKKLSRKSKSKTEKIGM